MDNILQGLNIQEVKLITLPQGFGLVDVGNMAVNQQLIFLQIKVLYIITGFAEIEAQHPTFSSSVVVALSKIEQNVGYEHIIVGAPIPAPGATKIQLKQLFHLSKQLQALCKEHPKFEFTKSGLLFYGPGGIYGNLMTQEGITLQGL